MLNHMSLRFFDRLCSSSATTFTKVCFRCSPFDRYCEYCQPKVDLCCAENIVGVVCSKWKPTCSYWRWRSGTCCCAVGVLHKENRKGDAISRQQNRVLHPRRAKSTNLVVETKFSEVDAGICQCASNLALLSLKFSDKQSLWALLQILKSGFSWNWRAMKVSCSTPLFFFLSCVNRCFHQEPRILWRYCLKPSVYHLTFASNRQKQRQMLNWKPSRQYCFNICPKTNRNLKFVKKAYCGMLF